MSSFVLERKYALQLPNSFVDIDSEEMEYIDGGITWEQKAIIVAGVTVAAVALTWAIVTGTIWYAAKVMGLTMKIVARQIGAKALTASIVGLLGTTWAGTYAVAKETAGW